MINDQSSSVKFLKSFLTTRQYAYDNSDDDDDDEVIHQKLIQRMKKDTNGDYIKY